MKLKPLSIAVLTIILPLSVSAEITFDWNGYGTLGVNKMDGQTKIDRDYFTPYGFQSELNAKQDSKIAIQGIANINDRLDFATQIIAKGKKDFEPQIEWAYAKVHLTDELQFMAGRQRRSSHLNSENFDIGYSYQFVRPPQTAYIAIGSIFDAIESLNLFYQGSTDLFDYSAQTYIGTAEGEVDIFGTDTHYKEHQNAGLTLTLETFDSQLRGGYHVSDFDIDKLPGGSEKILDAFVALGLPQYAEKYALTHEKVVVSTLGISTNFSLSEDGTPWRVSGEVASLQFEDSLLPDYLGSFAMLEKGFGDFTVHGIVGQQTSTPNEILANSVEATAGAAVASGTLAGMQQAAGLQELGATFAKLAHKRSVIALGLRYEASHNVAIKFEHEYIKNHSSTEGGDGRLYSASIDFVF